MADDDASSRRLSLADRTVGGWLLFLAAVWLAAAVTSSSPAALAVVVVLVVVGWSGWIGGWRSAAWVAAATLPLLLVAWDTRSFLLLWAGLLLYLVVVNSLMLQPTRARTLVAVALQLLLFAALVYPWVSKGRAP